VLLLNSIVSGTGIQGSGQHSSSRDAWRTDTQEAPKTGKVIRDEGLGEDVSDVVRRADAKDFQWSSSLTARTTVLPAAEVEA
jgi:hypothetical protein